MKIKNSLCYRVGVLLILVFAIRLNATNIDIANISTSVFSQPALNNFFINVVLNGNTKLAGLALKMGAQINATTTRGYSALHIAVLINNEALLKYLIKEGINLTSVNMEGQSALILAQQYNRNQLFLILLKSLSADNE